MVALTGGVGRLDDLRSSPALMILCFLSLLQRIFFPPI